MELISPDTLYGDWLNQFDIRVTKTFRTGRVTVRANFDLYNALNASPVLSLNNTYGPRWQQPTGVQPGRFFKPEVQIEF